MSTNIEDKFNCHRPMACLRRNSVKAGKAGFPSSIYFSGRILVRDGFGPACE